MGFFQFFGIRQTATATRDEAFLQSFGSPPPTINQNRVVDPYPKQDIAKETALAAQGIPNYYGAINVGIAKSYFINPTNQGQRGGIAARQSMMFDPRNSPSRSQFLQGYTNPVQLFQSGNTWNADSGLSSKGQRTRQPSTKAVSPFASVPIPVRMPWDL